VHIKIKKNIPVSAGMGGGSSDAAATLRGLNQLWDLNLSDKALMRLGARLGADVPFFLLPDAAAWGTGRGDRLAAVDIRRRFWLVVVKPPLAVSTREAYQALSDSLTKRKNNAKLLIYALNNSSLEEIGENLYNRLESVVFERYNSLARLKKKLSALGVRAVLMSGSGSVVFGLVANREEAQNIKRQLHSRHEVMTVRSF
jgi:4-diphosphocytidyl-2-C-methyl-D-erythritol kinase